MAGIKGQKNPSKHKRLNRYSAGVVESVREPEVFAFKIKKDLYPVVKADLQERGISKQQLCDELLDSYYSDEVELEKTEQPVATVAELPESVRDAIATSIQLKEAAISREKKSRRPDEGAIAQWEVQIQELEQYL